MRLHTSAALIAACMSLPLTSLALDQSRDVTIIPLLKTTTTWNGAAISYPSGTAEVTGVLVEIAPDAETGWHLHPAPSFAVVLEGTLEITLKDGRTHRVNASEAVTEVVNTPHDGHNVGDDALKLIVFYAGAAGQKLTVKEPG